MRLIASLLFLLLFPVTAFSSSQLFTDGAESGDLSNWTTSTAGVTASTDYARTGSYSIKISYESENLQGNFIDLTSSSPTDEFYVKFYVRVGDSYHVPYLGYKWMRLKHGNVDGIQTEFYLNSESWVSSGHTYQTGTSGLDSPDTGYNWNPDFDDGAWHKVEVYGQYNTSGLANGTCQIWFDGVERLNDTAYTWRNGDYSTDTFHLFYIPSNAGDGSHSGTTGDVVYVDDVEIWDGIPGGSIVLTGTAISGGVTEAEIVTGGETVIATVSGDTYVATACDDNAITTAMLAGIDGSISAQLTLDHTMCSRDSDTQVTLTLPATGGYDISATAQDTWTMPATALTGGEAIVATPDITISHIPTTTVKTTMTSVSTGAAVTKGGTTAPAIQ